eukprot:CAMPEP_0175130776 /NCGR_PEP_ID=MMETSP0087-20121206/6183_1 /TAXON_ID=136419 /ORGANISM="Unknown Unknown, Strain D1" /LENGTH=995 /DNA_ID=CAMNT_0016413009 /DNA_START=553 /DNA_END=3540 /DNA_ORIENTATION=-
MEGGLKIQHRAVSRRASVQMQEIQQAALQLQKEDIADLTIDSDAEDYFDGELEDAGYFKELLSEVSEEKALNLLKGIREQDLHYSMFSEEELELLVQVLAVLEFQEGDVVMKKGQESTFAAIILEGDFKAVVNETLTVDLAVGSLVGEMAFFERGQRSADIVAKSSGILGVVSFSEIVNLGVISSSLQCKILRFIGKTAVDRLRLMMGSTPVALQDYSIEPDLHQQESLYAERLERQNEKVEELAAEELKRQQEEWEQKKAADDKQKLEKEGKEAQTPTSASKKEPVRPSSPNDRRSQVSSTSKLGNNANQKLIAKLTQQVKQLKNQVQNSESNLKRTSASLVKAEKHLSLYKHREARLVKQSEEFTAEMNSKLKQAHGALRKANVMHKILEKKSETVKQQDDAKIEALTQEIESMKVERAVDVSDLMKSQELQRKSLTVRIENLVANEKKSAETTATEIKALNDTVATLKLTIEKKDDLLASKQQEVLVAQMEGDGFKQEVVALKRAKQARDDVIRRAQQMIVKAKALELKLAKMKATYSRLFLHYHVKMYCMFFQFKRRCFRQSVRAGNLAQQIQKLRDEGLPPGAEDRLPKYPQRVEEEKYVFKGTPLSTVLTLMDVELEQIEEALEEHLIQAREIRTMNSAMSNRNAQLTDKISTLKSEKDRLAKKAALLEEGVHARDQHLGALQLENRIYEFERGLINQENAQEKKKHSILANKAVTTQVALEFAIQALNEKQAKRGKGGKKGAYHALELESKQNRNSRLLLKQDQQMQMQMQQQQSPQDQKQQQQQVSLADQDQYDSDSDNEGDKNNWASTPVRGGAAPPAGSTGMGHVANRLNPLANSSPTLSLSPITPILEEPHVRRSVPQQQQQQLLKQQQQQQWSSQQPGGGESFSPSARRQLAKIGTWSDSSSASRGKGADTAGQKKSGKKRTGSKKLKITAAGRPFRAQSAGARKVASRPRPASAGARKPKKLTPLPDSPRTNVTDLLSRKAM